MALVHIAFYRGTRKENPKSKFLDNLICFATNSKYSHAELVLSYDEASNRGMCYSSSEWDGGVRDKYIHLEPDRWLIVPYETKYTKQEIVEFFYSHLGKKYDYLGALGVVLPFLSGRGDRWFCFEIVATALGFVDASRFDADNLMEVLYGRNDKGAAQ